MDSSPESVPKTKTESSSETGGARAEPEAEGEQAASASNSRETAIKVGILYPGTGPIAWYGNQFRKGGDLAFEQINNSDEYGFKLEPIWVDTKCDVAEATSATQRLIDQEQIAVLFGDFCSSPALASATVAQPRGVPQIIYGATGTDITEQGHPVLFRTLPHNDMLVGALADFIIHSGEYKTVAIQYVTTDFGIDGKEIMEQKLQAAGIEIVAAEGIDQADNNLYPFVTKIQPLDPDAVVMISQLSHGVPLVQAAHELGLKSQMMTTQILPWPVFDEQVGEAADGIIRQFLFMPTSPDPVIQSFVEMYKEKYNETPEHYVAEMYDAVMVVADAMRRANTASNGFNKDAFVEALRSTKDFTGLMGPIEFGEDGQSLFNDRVIFVQNDGSELRILQQGTGQ